MSTHAEALPDDQTNGRLALVLGLLGVPGSTVAWALPAGGFIIGLPLALAAIVLGLRAGGRAATAAVLLGVVEILFMASWTIAV